MGTLADNVAQVKVDFKSVRDAVNYAIPEGTPTSEYGERIQREIMNLQYQADSAQTQGVEQGKQEVISNSKYFEKTASGTAIRLDDVSEVYHNVKVKADTPTEVKVYGKNLFNNDTSLLKEVNFNGSTKPYSHIGYEIELPKGRYTFTIAKLDESFDGYIYGMINNKNGEYVGSFHLTENKNLFSPLLVTLDEGDKLYVYNAVGKDMSATTALFKKVNIQLSAYSTGGNFEKYQCQTITATPEGTEIPSICPTMTFLAENDITVDYYGSYSKHEFWTKYLSKQKTSGLYNGFAGYAWTDITFDPPIDIETNSSSNMFSYSFVEDLRGILAKNNAKIIFMNTSGAQHYNVFANSRLKYCPYLKLSESDTCYGFFTNCSRLIEVDGYECLEKHVFETSSGAQKTFQGCTELVHILFYGTIAKKLDIHWSKKLDRASILSLLTCLNATVSGIVITLPSMCIDGATDTLALIQGDTELNTAYNNALAKGYTISFV
jgi:hypothetical protein